MNAPPTLADVQAVVLHGSGPRVRHLLLHLNKGRAAHPLLHCLLRRPRALAADHPDRTPPSVQAGIGFTAEGLKRLEVPPRVLLVLGDRAPAFCAGAAARAAHLGDSGASAATRWGPAFHNQNLHAVVTLQATDPGLLESAEQSIKQVIFGSGSGHLLDVLDGERLGSPPEYQGLPGADRQHWVHFGYRDALSRVRIRGWDVPDTPTTDHNTSHAAGEFVLGRPQESGANPWALPTATQEVRDFFRDGSFGVLRKIEQNVDAFEDFITHSAQKAQERLQKWGPPSQSPSPAARAWVKAKLMGRWPAGMPLRRDEWVEPIGGDPERDHDYKGDDEGQGCPFGSHARRMNSREPAVPGGFATGSIAHALRRRPLIRRGLPYGMAWQPGDERPRGLLGMFFCASIEDQFEHLVGQWGATVPLGSKDAGNAADIFVAHQHKALPTFAIPLPEDASLRLRMLPDCVTTRGTAYLFYPGVHGLRLLTRQGPWRPAPGDDEVP